MNGCLVGPQDVPEGLLEPKQPNNPCIFPHIYLKNNQITIHGSYREVDISTIYMDFWFPKHPTN